MQFWGALQRLTLQVTRWSALGILGFRVWDSGLRVCFGPVSALFAGSWRWGARSAKEDLRVNYFSLGSSLFPFAPESQALRRCSTNRRCVCVCVEAETHQLGSKYPPIG